MTTASERTDARPAVTVIGLGEMGFALASAFLAGGHPTTVWNRTQEKADALVALGAERAATVREAVAASPLVVVSVKGNARARELLESSGEALSGRAVVNLTDGTSAETRAVADWAEGQGAEYLHGQVMTIAPGVGAAGTVVFYGGSDKVYDRYRPALRLLGGQGGLISADAGVPPLYGMAVHGTMWGALNGFLHAAALLSSEGIGVKRFLDDAGASVSALPASFPMLAAEVDRGEYATEYGALQHHRPSVEDLVRESRARNIDAELPGYTLDLVGKAVEEGHAGDSYSRLVEHFKKREWRTDGTTKATSSFRFGLHHVQLALPPGGEELCRSFYVDVLGMTELEKPSAPAARGGLWVRAGGLEIHLGVEEDFRPARKAHPGILVADLDGLANRLTSKGTQVTWDGGFPGHRRFHAADCHGNRLEFLGPHDDQQR